MDLFTLRIFQEEVTTQCRFSLVSIDALTDANTERVLLFERMRSGEKVEFEENDTRTWYALQTFLVAAANVHKILWGSDRGKAETVKARVTDRRQLRASLCVTEDSVLRLSPKFRNHFEHLDERIEEWATESVNRIHVNKVIGPPNIIIGFNPRDIFRQYDPSTHIMTFRGEMCDIPSVAKAIGALAPVAAREASKPHWET